MMHTEVTLCLIQEVKFWYQWHDYTADSYYLKHDDPLTLPVMKIAEFANSIDLDEVAHNEPPNQDLHCLPSSVWILCMI